MGFEAILRTWNTCTLHQLKHLNVLYFHWHKFPLKRFFPSSSFPATTKHFCWSKMDDAQWLMKVAIKNSTRKITFITKTSTTTALPFNLTTSNSDLFDDGNGSELLNSLSLLALIILYGIVVFSGVFGNSTLLISLCSQSTTRVKNPLLLALCAADLLVTMVSAPLTIIGVLLRQSRTASFSMANIGCKVFHYMQVICGFLYEIKINFIIHVVGKFPNQQNDSQPQTPLHVEDKNATIFSFLL